MQNFRVVATYTYPFEYAILKAKLQEEGIPHIFENETMIQVAPFYSNALGGIHLKVHEDYVDYVKQLITDFNNSSPLNIV
ncbi:DUF2007 domain-containing protein [Spongiivirga sp. MCCC 1A20706]|uniref:DUF2007 domain-containing protein n=1 Tax=Spongiivirga sp. MCCC 1A20706 TaxID=3160963 RepID=UPI00397735FC